MVPADNVEGMVRRRCRQAALGAAANCHIFRATGITAYLLNGGTLEHAQAIAAHESPRATKLYDRISDEITLDEIERSESNICSPGAKKKEFSPAKSFTRLASIPLGTV
jgi:hypothetical protein